MLIDNTKQSEAYVWERCVSVCVDVCVHVSMGSVHLTFTKKPDQTDVINLSPLTRLLAVHMLTARICIPK